MGGVILRNDASDGCAGYRRWVTTDRLAEGAGAPARRWFPAGVAESQWLATVVLAAAAGAVVLTVVAGPGIHQGRAAAHPGAGLRPDRCSAALAAAGARGGDRRGRDGRPPRASPRCRSAPARAGLVFLGPGTAQAQVDRARPGRRGGAGRGGGVLGVRGQVRAGPRPRSRRISCRWLEPGLSRTASRRGDATRQAWPRRQSASGPPGSGKSGCASPARCTTSSRTPSR